MRSRLLWSVLITIPVLCLGCSKAAPPDKKLAPIDALRGTWRAKNSATQTVEIVFTEEEMEMTIDRGRAASLTTLATISFPKEHPEEQMDWTDVMAGNRKLPDSKCLYQITGDQLLLISGGRRDRPTDFYSGSGSEPKTLILTRVKSE